MKALAIALVVLALPSLAQEPPGILPNPQLTPGAVYPVDEATVCGRVGGKTYEQRSRAALTQAVKDQITRAYGQEPRRSGDHELDHRVPAALAGRSDTSNVWYQPGRGRGIYWTYEMKDRLDTWAWRQVCVAHAVPLVAAQAWFMEPDWRRPYCREYAPAHGGDPHCAEIER